MIKYVLRKNVIAVAVYSLNFMSWHFSDSRQFVA